MRALRVVGITEGGGELSVVLEDSVRQRAVHRARR